MVLVDGSSYLYRAFHAMPALTNSRGEPTGAVYGVANMLRRLLKDYQPEHMAVVFDAPGRTFRDDIYPEYKANRPPMPDPLVAQIDPLHRVIEAMGLPLLMVPGVEADDVIGTLAREAAAQGIATIISTGDKDMAQLVDGHVRLVDTMQDRIYDREAVVAKFGVPPERIIDYLALVGDTSDNIPGVPGVGPKTAARWLNEFGSLDQLKARSGEVAGKAGETLRASLAQLEQARELATIRCDLKLPKHLPDLHRQAPDIARLRELYAGLEFKTWLSELGGVQPAGVPVNRDGYQTVLDEETLAAWIGRLERADLITVDTETTGLDAMQASIVGVSLCVTPGEAAYIPLAHDYPGVTAQLDRDKTLARLKPILEDAARAKIGQNLKYDINVFANHGIRLAGVRYDTMLESYVLDSTATRHDMDSLALKYLGEKTITFEEVAGKGKDQIGFAEVAIDKATAYAAEDADVTRRLHDHLWPRLCETPLLRKVFEEIEMPLVPVLARMERHGVRIEVDLLRTQSLEIERRLMELERQAHDQAGQVFNLASPKQIQEIFFDKLKLPVLKKTPKGQPSTAEEVLQELALDYPLPALILEHRGLAKLKSTYTDKLPEMIDPRSGRVHTSYHQAVAATGRLSSADPNLQNIPVRTAEGRRIRQAFIADAGCRIVSADYSQVELRIMAHLSGDAGLIRAFAGNQDIHRATAAEVFGLALDQVGDEQRRAAKAINFGLIYGMSAFGLARNLKIDRQSAQDYITRYFTRYPGVKDYMDRTRALARAQGYVETLFGRRLYLPELSSSNIARQQGAERAAINAPMQGTAADLIKRAMIVIDGWLAESMPAVRMIMQVHDELVFEVPAADVDALIDGVRQRMAGVAELAVPLVVDVGIGNNWDEAH
ncbi:MAG: DNA polymerase I [Candidatus Muproteobacteria bacterium RBG_16_62_13]|uniref:DNA polymerase I n=1 Tax=Candidatus Muproteobacteria bacterium RBG_16_62_13 TaxID=1817756 RepID=A0A1F6T4U5_9PROT|nr:MAG: DNA polymerase I [Candidatus Muproteobacteria bacterium RBG_16_62_13]